MDACVVKSTTGNHKIMKREIVPSLQLGTGKTAAVRLAGWLVGWLVGKSVSVARRVSVRVWQRAARPECVCRACVARPPCVRPWLHVK